MSRPRSTLVTPPSSSSATTMKSLAAPTEAPVPKASYFEDFWIWNDDA